MVVYKIAEVMWAIHRITANAAQYRKRARNAMAKTGAVNLDILREIEHDLVGRWPFIWKLVQAASRRGSVRGEAARLLVILSMWPSLMVLLALVIFTGRDDSIYLPFDIILEWIGILVGVASLAIDRAKLGFFENFRPILAANPQQREIAWTVSESVWQFTCEFMGTWVVTVIGFAAIFYGIHTHLGADVAFNWSHGCPETLDYLWLRFLYYSIVTIATVGYGDISCRDAWAVAATGTEIVTGFLLIVILVFSFTANMKPDD